MRAKRVRHDGCGVVWDLGVEVSFVNGDQCRSTGCTLRCVTHCRRPPPCGGGDGQPVGWPAGQRKVGSLFGPMAEPANMGHLSLTDYPLLYTIFMTSVDRDLQTCVCVVVIPL